jgi:hypothetical protein
LTLRVEVRFEPRSLVRANDGLDLEACAERYAIAVAAAIEADLPAAVVVVRPDPGARGVRALATGGADDAENRSAERLALDLAWAVRDTVAYT